MPPPSLTGMNTSGGVGPCLCVGLVPTLAVDTGRAGIAGSGVGTATGCENFGEDSGDGIRKGVVTGMGFNTLSTGGSVIPGAIPPPPPPGALGGTVVVVALGGGDCRVLVVVRL